MKKYYKDLAPILYKQGYKPIPIRPKSKIPFMSKGESWQVDINEKQISDWAANGKGGGGIAVTGIGGLDFDIKNKKVSNEIIKYLKADSDIKGNILIRVGLPPKFLIPVSADSDIPKKWKNTWYDKQGEKHEIEFLSPGDQYFLTHGIHPETGTEYKWVKDVSIIDIPVNDLPVVDDMDLSAIEDKFNTLAKKMGWTRSDGTTQQKKKRSPAIDTDPLENMKSGGDMADPAGIAELEAWLKLLPSDWVNDRDNWITIGAAIHHETGGSNNGWCVFDAWSSISKKYKGRSDTIIRWESFDKEKGLKDGTDCVSRGTIIHILKEAGCWDEAQKTGNKARDSIGAAVNLADQEKDESELIKQMNKKHAIIRINSKIRVMQEGKNIDGMLDLSFLSPADFRFMYSNKYTTDPKDPKKKKTIDKIWLSSPCRREYNGIVFEPKGSLKTPEQLEGYYNIWKGLSIKPKKGDWRRFEDHIYEIIADGNNTIGEWIIAWIARMVQSPGGERPGTSIVLKGGQGTGKGVFVNTVGAMFGDHFMPVSHASQVAGRFNSHLTNKILVFIDEGFWAGDKQAEGVLKSMITEPYLAIEQKGVDIIKIKNNINLIIASNNEWIVPANIAERRFCVLDVSENKQGDKAYFKKVMQQMYQEGGLQAMLYDLLKMDISDIDLGNFEQTQGLYEQKIHSMSIEMKYWHERLIDGEMLAYSDDDSTESDFGEYSTYKGEDWGRIDCEKLYRDYLFFADRVKERYPLSPTQFGIFLKKICPGVQKFQHSTGKRKRFYHFPVIEDCRKYFEKQIKQNINWEILTEEDNDLF